MLFFLLGDISFVYIESISASTPSLPPFLSTHTGAVASQIPPHLLSSASCHIELRLNISLFLFDVLKIPIHFAVDYYCVIGNEGNIFEYSIIVNVRTKFRIFHHKLSKLRIWLFGPQPVTTSRVF